MPATRLTHTVNGPIGDVFALVADLTTHPTWSPDVKSCSKITDSPVGLGTRFLIELQGLGKMELEVTEYEVPSRVKFSGRHRMGDTRHLFAMTPDGERTRVDQVLEMRPGGLFRLIAPVMGIMLKRGLPKTAGGLERHYQRAADSA